MNSIKSKNLISLLTALCFVVLAVSGTLSFFIDYSKKLATIHTIFGYFFIGLVGLHMTNNWASLGSYIKKKQ